MGRRVRLTKLADSQIEQAIRWWRRERAAAPDLLEEELLAVIDRLAGYPESGVAATGETRRVILRRARSLLYYRVVDDVVEIHGLRHGSRRPR